jgi:crooked neck
VVLQARRQTLEQKLDDEQDNYDLWFDYCNLEEQAADCPEKIERIRAVYERAIVNLPPASDKRFWKRFIYLWINFAIFEEQIAMDREKAQLIYEKILSLIPHA